MASEGYLTTDGGVRLFYQQVGNGPQVVIVPNGIFMFETFKHLAAARTVIFYDLRNYGRSDVIHDKARLAGGIHHDVDDLEAVRWHFGIPEADILAHSYPATMATLYAMKYPQHLGRIVQIGPVPPRGNAQYSPQQSNADEVQRDVFAKFAELHRAGTTDPEAWWKVLRPLYVADPADAEKVPGAGVELSSEAQLNMMRHSMQNIAPSLQLLHVTSENVAGVRSQVLIIHGRKDRSSPYGGGREWAAMLPNARLLTIDGGAHMPWIEAPELVFGSIDAFLSGQWPEKAREVTA
jgi:proline iminopeptidase